jgi:transposase
VRIHPDYRSRQIRNHSCGLLRASARPLAGIETTFAIDSTGFRTTSFGAYLTEKHGAKRQNIWLKAHLCAGVKTHIISDAIVTDANGADAPQLPALVQATSEGFIMSEVSADKAYSSRANHEAIVAAGAMPYIPFKSNATGRSHGGSLLWTKAFHLFQANRDEFDAHYHKRSNVESANSAIKRKFGETLKSKNRVAQENELLCKLIAYNLTVVIHEMHENGIDPSFCTRKEAAAPQMGSGLA